MKKLRNILVGLGVVVALTVPQNVLMAGPPDHAGPPTPLKTRICNGMMGSTHSIPTFVIQLVCR